jgi:hypothetical protein
VVKHDYFSIVSECIAERPTRVDFVNATVHLGKSGFEHYADIGIVFMDAPLHHAAGYVLITIVPPDFLPLGLEGYPT